MPPLSCAHGDVSWMSQNWPSADGRRVTASRLAIAIAAAMSREQACFQDPHPPSIGVELVGMSLRKLAPCGDDRSLALAFVATGRPMARQSLAQAKGLTAIDGIKVGHHTLTDRPTGCTVILVEAGATGGVDVRGSAPGTRETDLLDPIEPRRAGARDRVLGRQRVRPRYGDAA